MKKTASIPTLLALPILVFVIIGLSFGSSSAVKFFSRASNDVPRIDNLTVANETDQGWSVGWTTNDKTRGVVYFGPNENLGEVAIDDREASGISGEFQAHLVSVKVPKPGKYYYKIGIGSSSMIGKPDGGTYEVVIPGNLGNGQNLEPIYGKVFDSSGTPVKGALVKLDVDGAQSLISLTNADGLYVLPLSTWRRLDLSGLFNPPNDVSEKIEIYGPNGEKSNVLCIFGDDRQVVDVRLGEDFDCRNPVNPALIPSPIQEITPNSTETKTGNKFKEIQVSKTVLSVDQSDLTTLEKGIVNVTDGQVFDNSLPTFSGQTEPGQVIQIEIHSETPISSTLRARSDGSWSWTPPANLAPGEHTVTLTIVLANGQTQTVSRKFTISQNSDILPITNSYGDNISPLITPTTTLTPSYPTPTLEQLPSPSPIDLPTPTPPSPPPETGSIGPTLLIIFSGLIFLLGSLVIAL